MAIEKVKWLQKSETPDVSSSAQTDFILSSWAELCLAQARRSIVDEFNRK